MHIAVSVVLTLFSNVAIQYLESKYSIKIKDFLQKYLGTVPQIEVRKEIKTTTDVDAFVKSLPIGLRLKHQFKLEHLNHVYIRKSIGSTPPLVEIIFDSVYDRSLSSSTLEAFSFYKTYVNNSGRFEPRRFTVTRLIESWITPFESNANLVKIDLAGKYYSKYKEGIYSDSDSMVKLTEETEIVIQDIVKLEDSIKLTEFTLPEWMRSGLSYRNKYFNQERQKANYKVELFRSTYNLSTNNIMLWFRVTPTYAGGKDYVNTVDTAGHKRQEKYYTNRVAFLDVGSILKEPQEWALLSAKDKVDLVNDIITGSEVKIHSNDPSYFYQGSWFRVDKLGSALVPFPKEFGDRGIWAKKHGNQGIYLTKHFIDIFKYLLSKKYDVMVTQSITDEIAKKYKKSVLKKETPKEITKEVPKETAKDSPKAVSTPDTKVMPKPVASVSKVTPKTTAKAETPKSTITPEVKPVINPEPVKVEPFKEVPKVESKPEVKEKPVVEPVKEEPKVETEEEKKEKAQGEILDSIVNVN